MVFVLVYENQSVILSSFVTLLFLAYDDDSQVLNYINNYNEIAVIEMSRTGIPASIKLAQAIHESASGTSDLAVGSKNHFGIKCKSYWKGETYFHMDDDFDKAGNLIKSCFRSYDYIIDSYIDHSCFLTNSANYQWIFGLDDRDYRKWAEALQYSGYSTDKAYATKLIKIIEKYNLRNYDSL